MENQVLVAYSTKYGATAEIAEKIGEVLRQAIPNTDVIAVDRVRDLSSYQAVVVGSAVYIGQWRKEAARFLKTNVTALTKQLVWLFSSGPTGEGDPVELTKGWRFPKGLQSVADRIQPRDIAVFHGAAYPKKMNPLHRWMIGKVDSPTGDFRDWDAIESWAKAIADELKEKGPAS